MSWKEKIRKNWASDGGPIPSKKVVSEFVDWIKKEIVHTQQNIQYLGKLQGEAHLEDSQTLKAKAEEHLEWLNSLFDLHTKTLTESGYYK